ncbi:MAG TPA: hypothetical protein VFO16_24235 [Pseudonocardiaceae bacterium]|nr:hypothetical protein [Pseudonocardiaceae bacterium]
MSIYPAAATADHQPRDIGEGGAADSGRRPRSEVPLDAALDIAPAPYFFLPIDAATAPGLRTPPPVASFDFNALNPM